MAFCICTSSAARSACGSRAKSRGIRCSAGRSHSQQSVAAGECGVAGERQRSTLSRRDGLLLASGMVFLAAAQPPATSAEESAVLKTYTPMDALKGKDYGKPRLRYPDFVSTESGLQYKDLREGTGSEAQQGDTIVMDWDGYTIGYYGRPFEARNKPKGSSFSGDNKDYYRFVLGQHTVIPAVEEAIAGMKEGGIRRIIVPEEIGYPDGGWDKQGPAPSTFAGQRALGFVLGNRGMIDKTLLFDLELVRVQRS